MPQKGNGTIDRVREILECLRDRKSYDSLALSLNDPPGGSLLPWVAVGAPDAGETGGLRSDHTVPLEDRGEVIGFLRVEARSADAFGESERRWLDIVGGLIANLIESDRRTTTSVNVTRRLARSEAELRRLASELLLAEERERHRIARGVHDEIGQRLALTQLKLGRLPQPQGDTGHAETLSEVRDLVREMMDMTRTLTFEISSPVLHELGLAAALQSLCERTELDRGIGVGFSSERRSKRLAGEIEVVLYHIVRELMRNAITHGMPKQLDIVVTENSGRIAIVVTDDGSGFDTSQTDSGFTAAGGFGLFCARQQLAAIGGTLSIDSTIGKGTRAVVVAPA